MPLEERIEFANRFPHAVFISIHFNSSSGGAGIESFRLAPEGVPSSVSDSEEHAVTNDPDNGHGQDTQNVALAAAVHASVLSRTQAFDRGVRHARFKVLRHIRLPAVLLEAGFLNNSAEGQRIASPSYRQQLGAAIADGVRNYDAAVTYRERESSSFAFLRTSLPPHTRSITEPLHPETAPAAEPHEPTVSVDGGH